jgi:mannose-6-phosphate isomerase
MVWGGEKIAKYKDIQTDIPHIGESWEISDYPDHPTVVANGPLAGKTLRELVKEYKGQLVGEHVYATCGEEFPLLIKFIDAHRDLSIQVHPNDSLAANIHGPGVHGKTEMWYVIGADPGAKLYCGLSRKIGPEEYEKMVADGSITEALACYEVKPGDVFFLPAGRVHAICSGCLVAEIQQTSDLTYRIWDYGRLGLDGKPRQLHTELAEKAIDYNVLPTYRTSYEPLQDEEVVLVNCKYFTTSLYDLTLPYARDLSEIDSFMVVMCVSGAGTLEVDGESIGIKQGETILIPADADDLCFIPEDGMKLITSYIQ